jgi:hypothetical protein
MTYVPGFSAAVAATLGDAPVETEAHLRCNGCGATKSLYRWRGTMPLLRAWAMKNRAPPGWRMDRVEIDAGVDRQDWCPDCKTAPSMSEKKPNEEQRKTKPGFYGTSPRSGKVIGFRLTQAMIDRRTGIAKGLGYVLRDVCSMHTRKPEAERDPGYKPFQCWERNDLDREEPNENYRGASTLHHVFKLDMHRHHRYAEGVFALSWPEDAETAAYAIDKGKPLSTDPADVPGSATAAAPPPQLDLLAQLGGR